MSQIYGLDKIFSYSSANDILTFDIFIILSDLKDQILKILNHEDNNLD